MASFLSIKTGLRKYEAKKSAYTVIIEPSVASVRPFTVCAVVRGIKFDSEKIKEVKVTWKNEDVSSGKSRNFVKESIEMFLEILRVRINDMLGKYEHIVH